MTSFYLNILKIYNIFFKLIREQNIIYNYDYILENIQKFALNIERGIFNSVIENTGPGGWSLLLRNNYTAKAVKIFSNLNPDSYLKNINLINRLFKREFNEFELVNLNQENIFPEKYNEIKEKCIALEPKLQAPIKLEDQPEGMHKCARCASEKKLAYKTTYYQLQTRSAEIIGLKSILLITFWLCYLKNSYSPNKYISYLKLRC
jgi:hypothetical protein